jgi:hypothetical protein
MSNLDNRSGGKRRKFFRALSLTSICGLFLPRALYPLPAEGNNDTADSIVMSDSLPDIDVLAGSQLDDRTGNQDLSRKTRLEQNYPNPFRRDTTIEYYIAEPGHAVLKVLDLRGREVSVLVDAFHKEGRYYIKFIARNLSDGAYICRLQTGDIGLSRKMVLAK